MSRLQMGLLGPNLARTCVTIKTQAMASMQVGVHGVVTFGDPQTLSTSASLAGQSDEDDADDEVEKGINDEHRSQIVDEPEIELF